MEKSSQYFPNSPIFQATFPILFPLKYLCDYEHVKKCHIGLAVFEGRRLPNEQQETAKSFTISSQFCNFSETFKP